MDQLLVEFHQRFFDDLTRHNGVLNGLKSNVFEIINDTNGQEIMFQKRKENAHSFNNTQPGVWCGEVYD